MNCSASALSLHAQLPASITWNHSRISGQIASGGRQFMSETVAERHRRSIQIGTVLEQALKPVPRILYVVEMSAESMPSSE